MYICIPSNKEYIPMNSHSQIKNIQTIQCYQHTFGN